MVASRVVRSGPRAGASARTSAVRRGASAGCGGNEDEQADAPEAPELGEIRARGLTCLAGIGGDGKAVITFAPGQFGPTIDGHYRPRIEPAVTAWTPERGYVLLDHPTPDPGETWMIAITNTITREIRWSMLLRSGDGGGTGRCTIPRPTD